MIPNPLTLRSILDLIIFGMAFCLGWQVMSKLWSLLGDRGQLIVAVVVLVIVLVLLVLVYRGG